ncbi:MAG: phosphatase PAP2 family protein [Ginsengibacter sp.]
MDNKEFKGRFVKLFTTQLIIAIVLFIVTLTAFVAITDEIVLEHESTFDTIIYSKVSTIDSPAMTHIFEAVTFFGSRDFLLPAYVILILIFLKKKKWALAIDVTFIGLTTTLLLDLLKNIFKRTRPLDPLIQNVTGFSYPSGHSFSAYTFYGLIVFIIWKTGISNAWKIVATILFFIVATSIAFSRVYLRVHYPSDVIAGFCLSVIWLIISLWLLKKKNKYLPGKKL